MGNPIESLSRRYRHQAMVKDDLMRLVGHKRLIETLNPEAQNPTP